MKWIILVMLAVGMSVSVLLVTGCESEAQNKALIGTAVGAGVGQAVGRDTKSTMIGAGVGAGTGYVWGRSQDKKKEAAQQQRDVQPAQQGTAQPGAGNTVSVWVTNSNGSQTEVKLTRNPDGSYTGPKGERYAAMPTEEQLKKAYGF